MKKEIALDFCDIEVYDNYIIVEMKEGVTISPIFNDILIDISNNYFDNKSFVYISHRVNSYAVNPEIYYRTSQIKNLKGFAVVSEIYQAKINAQIEKHFYSKPFEIFTNMDDALLWTNKIIKNEGES